MTVTDTNRNFRSEIIVFGELELLLVNVRYSVPDYFWIISPLMHLFLRKSENAYISQWVRAHFVFLFPSFSANKK